MRAAAEWVGCGGGGFGLRRDQVAERECAEAHAAAMEQFAAGEGEVFGIEWVWTWVGVAPSESSPLQMPLLAVSGCFGLLILLSSLPYSLIHECELVAH